MSSKPVTVSLAALAVIIAGCGSSGSSSTRSGARPTGRSAPTVYRTHLMPAGARTGAGDAVVALHGGSRVCWRFAHLHGFRGATGASIGHGAPGGAGKPLTALSSGRRLRHRGCRRVSASLSNAIRHSPSDYFVNVNSRQFPAGAVSGRL
jgi:CHRD domain